MITDPFHHSYIYIKLKREREREREPFHQFTNTVNILDLDPLSNHLPY